MFQDKNRIPSVIGAIEEGTAEGTKEIAKETVNQIEDGFDNGEDALGNQWEELSDATIRKKGHSQILIEDGELQSSFDYAYDPAETEAIVGTSDPKAQFHEFGVPENGVPARPILRPAAIWIEKNYETEMGDLLDRHLKMATF